VLSQISSALLAAFPQSETTASGRNQQREAVLVSLVDEHLHIDSKCLGLRE
jgi:hypothetical protein